MYLRVEFQLTFDCIGDKKKKKEWQMLDNRKLGSDDIFLCNKINVFFHAHGECVLAYSFNDLHNEKC